MIDQLPKSLLESVQQIVEKETEYQKFFKGALDKFGVTSPKELTGDKEKEFYNYIDKNWKGKTETDEASCSSDRKMKKEEVELDEKKELTFQIHKDGKPLKKGSKTVEIYGVAKAKKMVDDLNKKHRGSKFTAHHVYKDGDDLDESVELDEATKTFNSLEDWVMAVVNAGGTISKRANNLVASGLGRKQSATFELKKGRGSMLESNETE